MKKYIYLLVALFGLSSAVNANGVNVGVSILGGVFDADGTEKFTGDHVSGASADNVTKKTIFFKKLLINSKLFES